jgi:FKBP12-rapamycin complex-associated protein
VGTGLPIDISNLAELALKCRSYAKALHYKEREYSQGGSGNGGCVESLISINKKLDLPEAALGVLKTSQLQMNAESGGALQTQGYGAFSDHLTSHFLRNGYTEELRYSVVASTDLTYDNPDGGAGISEVRESWLSKLGSWSEALQIYEDKLSRNPQDFDAILGCMRCLDASGEWQRVLDIAEQSWPTLSGSALRKILKEANADSMNTHLTPKGKRKFLKFGAQAAWRLADWDGLEKYASALVHGNFDNPLGTSQSSRSKSTSGGVPVVDFDGAFFSAVIHIHRKQWSQAATAIDAARQAMDARFTALMAESYKRAYSGMISAQILAEMEEIIAYRKLESRAIASSHRHPTNRPNMEEARPKLLSVWRDRLAGCRVDADVHSKILAVRSLVLGPTDEVQATLMLSDLSKQARMFKLAEKTLLDPLVKLGANLSGPVFGFGLPEDLGLGLSIIENIGSANGHIIDRLVTGQATEFRPMYGAMHEQCCEQIVQEAGGLERYGNLDVSCLRMPNGNR